MQKCIDISEHNGTIDFNKVKNEGIESVIIRVGWIGNKKNHTIDKNFKENYKKASSEKFNIGFYVYSYCESLSSLKNGIEWLQEQIKDKEQNIGVFLDLENSQISYLSKEELTEHAIYFSECFKSGGIYANKNWYENKLNLNKLQNYNLWLAEWNGKSKFTLDSNVNIWQYTSDGEVKGINGRVDLNYIYDNIEEKKEEFEVSKKYKNGSTIEKVYSDSALKNYIGYLNKYEVCECLGKENGNYLVKYKVDNMNYYKVGFVKYSGGIK